MVVEDEGLLPLSGLAESARDIGVGGWYSDCDGLDCNAFASDAATGRGAKAGLARGASCWLTSRRAMGMGISNPGCRVQSDTELDS